MQNINEKALAVTAEVSKAVLGKPEVVLKIMMAILARGHVLIEDIPGVGKTTLAQAFARAMVLAVPKGNRQICVPPRRGDVQPVFGR